jgi:hypothetical protein
LAGWKNEAGVALDDGKETNWKPVSTSKIDRTFREPSKNQSKRGWYGGLLMTWRQRVINEMLAQLRAREDSYSKKE